MSLIEDIRNGKEYIDKLRNEYIEKHIRIQERDELIAENNIEARDIKGYHGREILELLQNADDAYQKSLDNNNKPDCDLNIIIFYNNNTLTVTNTGTCFDEAGIKAIVQGNNSPKRGKYIGSKGTGFRSLLNWANKVEIHSGRYNVEFSKEEAKRCFESIKDKEQIRKQIESHPNLYIPMLAVPINLDKDTYNDITSIEVEIDPEKSKDDFSVSNQINNIDLKILLFLPNTSQIDIRNESHSIIYKREILSDLSNCVVLKKIIEGKEETEESYYLFKKDISNAIEEDGVMKDIQLAIAVPRDKNDLLNAHLYSFFPLLDTTSPFNCVFHASYILGDHRNTVNINDSNAKIMKEQINYLIETAVDFIKKGQSEIAYSLLIPTTFKGENWDFASPFSNYKLKEYYLEMLLDQKIFLTVNNEYISIMDSPKYINGTYPESFKGERFNTLLKPIENEKLVLLLKALANEVDLNLYYGEEELLSVINSFSKELDIKEQVEVFIWWNEKYKNSLPDLLKTQDGRWLGYGQECYLLAGNFDKGGLPSWVKVPALQREYQQELLIQTGNLENVKRLLENEPQITRIICQNNIFSTVIFKYRDRSNIITTVNSSVDSYNKAIDFIRWLWKNYSTESDWNPPGRIGYTQKINYNFPDMKNKDVIDSEKLYFGKDYDNPLAEKLFDSSFGVFPSIDSILMKKCDILKFRDFISKFGVKTFPPILLYRLTPNEKYNREMKKEILSKEDLGQSSFISEVYYSLPYIKNLATILNSVSTVDIIKWIIKDTELYNCLSNQYYSNDAKIQYKGNRQTGIHTFYGRIKNYILEVFNNTKWINIEGQKYSPRQILKESRNNLKYRELVPILEKEYIELLENELKENVSDIFDKFSFAEKITDLSSEDFYGLMLKIPEIQDRSISMELSKGIYRIIEQYNFTKSFEPSDNKKRFMYEGLILVKYQGEKMYYPSRDAYLPSSKIINKRDTHIVDKGVRTNNTNFVNVFGCKEYTEDYSVDTDSIIISEANDSFQVYFRDFQRYACAYSERNENIEKNAKNLCITLVKEISIISHDTSSKIEEEYIYIREKPTKWYITVFNSEFDINTVSEIIENIYDNIARTSGFEADKVGELFRTKDQKSREFLIKKEFGSLSVIDDELYQNEIRNNFINVLNEIDPEYPVDNIKIDFSDFFDISNSPIFIELFNEIGVDIEDFKSKGFEYEIDLVPYYKKQLKEYINKEKRRFKDYIFKLAKSDINLQKEFINKVTSFEQFELSEYQNSVLFNVQDAVINEFGSWICQEQLLSAEEEYSKNYEKLNPENIFGDIISNNKEIQQMIYFGKANEFNEWLKKEKESLIEENVNADLYSSYKNVVPSYTDVTYQNATNNITKKKNTVKGAYTRSQDEKERTAKKIYGNKAEQLAYNYYCKKYGKDKVIPRSEAFVDLGILKPGQEKSGLYDLSYIGEGGSEFFVEVKGSDGHSFTITPGELEFAQENPEKFKLMLVYEIEKAPDSKCAELPDKFWEDERYRLKPIIEKIRVEF